MVTIREIWRRWKPETVFPETGGGAGPWEQRTTSRGLRCHQAGKNAGVTSVRDPEKPDEPEETGRGTLCPSSKDWGRDCCLQSHRSRCGKRCRRRFHVDNNVSVGSSCGQTWFDNDKWTEGTLRCLWRNDYVTERECLDPCELRENTKHRCRILGRQSRCSSTHSNHCLSETNTCQGCVGMKRTRWTPCESDHQRWARAQNERHACVGRLQVYVGETPVGHATRERCEWLHLQSTRRRTDTIWCPCVARPTERDESENATQRCEIHE